MRNTSRILALLFTAVLLAAVTLLASCLPTTTTAPQDQQQSGWTSTVVMVGFIALIFVMMYFLTIRPQRRRQQEQQRLISELQKGDRVITIGGLYGTVESVAEDNVVIRTESGALMRFVKSAIANRLTQPPANTGP